MTSSRPYPDFWYPVAALLSALRKLLRGAAPDTFAAIALDARAHLAAITALVRRYIHVLAADISLPPLPPKAPPEDETRSRAGASSRRYRFSLVETPAARSGGGAGEDPPELQLILMLEAVGHLVSVLANPAPHALRLARFLRRKGEAMLRELPVRWHVLRRVGPGIDTLLMALDRAARPQAWDQIDTS